MFSFRPEKTHTTQWAAVSTFLVEIKVPPQKNSVVLANLPTGRKRAATQGHAPSLAIVPLTILLLSDVETGTAPQPRKNS